MILDSYYTIIIAAPTMISLVARPQCRVEPGNKMIRNWKCVVSAGCNKQPPQQSYLTLAYDIDVNGIAAYIQLG